MTGRPDYDAGDLVVAVPYEGRPQIKRATVEGRVYRIESIVPPEERLRFWGCFLVGLRSNADDGRFDCRRFRRIDPKPPEFFAGKIETVREDELV